MAVAELIEHEAEQRPEQKPKVNVKGVEELQCRFSFIKYSGAFPGGIYL
jgi:hypothetical protein